MEVRGGSMPCSVPKCCRRGFSHNYERHMRLQLDMLLKRLFQKKITDYDTRIIKKIASSIPSRETSYFAKDYENSKCKSNLANAPPLSIEFLLVFLLLFLSCSIANSIELPENKFGFGAMDSTFSISKDANIRIKGAVTDSGAVKMERLEFEKKLENYKDGELISLFGELGDENSIKFYAHELKEEGKLSIVLSAQDRLSKIREIIITDGEALDITYNNGEKAEVDEDYIASINLEGAGSDVVINIVRDYSKDEFVLTKDNSITLPTGTLELKITDITDGGPLNFVEIYGVPEIKIRLGSVVDNNIYNKEYSYKDTTMHGCWILKATVRKGDRLHMYTTQLFADATKQPANMMVTEIGNRGEGDNSRKPHSYNMVYGQAETDSGAYFRKHYPDDMEVRIRGPPIESNKRMNYNEIFSVYHWGEPYNMSAYIFQPDTTTQSVIGWHMGYEKDNDYRVYIKDSRLVRGYRHNGGPARVVGYTTDTTDKNDFRIKLVRTGDPVKSDSICIWDMSPEYQEKLATFGLISKPYETNADTTTNLVDMQKTSKQQLLVYPNPNNGEMTVILPGDDRQVWLNIYDANGKFVKNVYTDYVPKGEDELLTIDVKDLAPGVYFVRAGDKSGMFIKE